MEGAAAGGGFQLGFEVRPLTTEGGLDTSLDNTGVMHSLEHDMLYKMAMENREGGNKMVQEGQHEQAIGRYSELIMQLRSLENEQDVKWDDAARLKVRELRATAYLNLSLCFLKLEQWTHATNTATRALQGDKDPADPKDAVLPPEKRAKALFRRAQAQCEGFGNFDRALEDLRKALEYTPQDKAVEQMMKKCDLAVRKTSKAADRKMAGFLKKEDASGEGLFDDSLRPSPDAVEKPKELKEPIKLKEGLWVAPKAEAHKEAEKAAENDEEINVENLGREIAEIREEDPALYEEMRQKVQQRIEEMVEEKEKEAAESPEKADEGAAGTEAGA